MIPSVYMDLYRQLLCLQVSLTTLVLGADIPRNTLAERAIIAQKARKLMRKHMAAAKIKTAINKKTLAAARCAYQPSDQVLVWRKKQIENRKGKYIGPYMIIAFNQSTRKYLSSQARKYISSVIALHK